MTHQPVHTEGLPMSLVDVAETLGMGVALKLIQAFGGQEVKFPKNPGPDHEIIKALGETDGPAICQFLGGTLVYIPHGRPRRSSKAEILALEAKGHDRRQIARILGLSQRHVRRSANQTGRDAGQPDLFDL